MASLHVKMEMEAKASAVSPTRLAMSIVKRVITITTQHLASHLILPMQHARSVIHPLALANTGAPPASAPDRLPAGACLHLLHVLTQHVLHQLAPGRWQGAGRARHRHWRPLLLALLRLGLSLAAARLPTARRKLAVMQRFHMFQGLQLVQLQTMCLSKLARR